MLKNLTAAQLFLITIASVVLLLAAFSFILLQDPSAPLPFTLLPATRSVIPSPPSETLPQPTYTETPVRQTSYTPFASLLTPSSSPQATPSAINPSPIVEPSKASPSENPLLTATAMSTSSGSITSPTPSYTSPPVITETLSPGQSAITGRVVQDGTPVTNVILEFEDDIAPRSSSTNSTGHYWFTSLAPGASFSLTFKQSANPRLTPPAKITSLAWIQGSLPTNIDILSLPDLEISINLNDIPFELEIPVDGASYSAGVISISNPIQFTWTPYNQGGSYHVELGPTGSLEPTWTSGQRTETNFMWDGTLNSGGHITQGTYWWRVAVTKSVGNYMETIFTQPWDILLSP